MTYVALGNKENYTIGGLRFYFAADIDPQTPIAITAVTIGPLSTVTVAGDQTALIGKGSKIQIDGSTGNDGTYRVISAVFTTSTVITLEETLPSATADGDIILIRKKELYLGNVVTGGFNSDITFLDHFTAKSGSRVKDRSVAQETTINVNLTLDEPNVDNMNLFMLGGDITTFSGTPAGRKFAPFTLSEKAGGARVAGVSDTGNEWVWTLYECSLKPDGDFSYNDQDWSQFSFVVEVLSDSDAHPEAPFGILEHYGVDEDIDVNLPLTGN